MRLNQRYEIQRTLVSGSDSHTHAGHDHLRNLPVLIKEFVPSALQDWKRFQLIEREAKILAQFNHIEIPDFVDFFTKGEGQTQSLFLVTQWINGQTLAEKLEAGWRASLNELFDIADMALRLLIYIHAFNPPIVHRDLKPSNFMFSPHQRLFLLDFGGVQEALDTQGAGGSTLVGTLGYMSPEQLMGRAEPASDLYALGLTLLVCLTGLAPESLPFDDQQFSFEGCEKQLGKSLGLSKAMQRWLSNLCARDLSLRYVSARDAIEDLDVVRFGEVRQRDIYLPENHKANVPEIIHSLTLIERAEDAHLKAGSLLQGRFEIGDLLGSGTHSRVYAASHKQRQRAVIVKELLLEDVTHWKNIELFEREVDTLKQLKHPQIPDFVESFQMQEADKMSWYLVTEALAAQPLNQLLAEAWRPDDTTVWLIAEQILEILVYLQSQDPVLVHRDIKPSNLLWDNKKVYLIDFGAVQNRLWASGGGGSTIIGTFGYMAPELFGGQASAASDLYSLGATLVNLLSGKHPIEIPLEMSGLNFEPFVRCSEFHVYWLKALLHPLPQERFATAQEALSLLQAVGTKKANHWLNSRRNETQAQGANPKVTARRLMPKNVPLEELTSYFKGMQLQVLPMEADPTGMFLRFPEQKALRLANKRVNRELEKFTVLVGGYMLLGFVGIALLAALLESPTVSFFPLIFYLISLFVSMGALGFGLIRRFSRLEKEIPLPLVRSYGAKYSHVLQAPKVGVLALQQRQWALFENEKRHQQGKFTFEQAWSHFKRIEFEIFEPELLTPLGARILQDLTQENWRLGVIRGFLGEAYYHQRSAYNESIVCQHDVFFVLPKDEILSFELLVERYLQAAAPGKFFWISQRSEAEPDLDRR